MDWKKWNKINYVIPVIFIVVASVFLAIQIIEVIEKKDVRDKEIVVDLENYAYKAVTGHHSPYLIEGGDSYAVDIDMGLTRDKVDSSGNIVVDESGNPVKEEVTYEEWLATVQEDFRDIASRPGDYGETSKGMLGLYEDKSGLQEKYWDILNYIFITDVEWDSDAAVKKIQDTPSLNNMALNIVEHIDTLIDGTFNWGYKSRGNKENFLAFRVGEYYYDGRVISADLMYERAFDKVRERKITIKASYDKSKAISYIHPIIDGFAVEVPLTLRITEDGITETYTMEYISKMGYKTPSPRDVWNLWTTPDDYVQMIATDYVRNIKKVGD